MYVIKNMKSNNMNSILCVKHAKIIPEKLFLMMGEPSRNAFLLDSIFFSKSFNTKNLKKTN